jgi:CubicO group peptidase (beta-lactamase class C family)
MFNRVMGRRCLLNLLILVAAFPAPAAARQEWIALDTALERLRNNGSFSGAVVIRAANGISFAKGYGFADPFSARAFEPATRVDSASLAKPMTAAAVLWLAQKRRIDLDAPMVRYVAEFPHRATTVRQLLTHSAGLPDLNQLEPLANKTNADMLTEIGRRNLPPAFTPGSAFSYCNSCYNGLALLIERVTGQPYLQFLQAVIGLPAGADLRPSALAQWTGRAIGFRRGPDGRVERADSFEGEVFYGSANLSIDALALAQWGTRWWTSLSPIRKRATEPVRIGSGRSGLTLGNWYCAPKGSRCHYLGHHEGFHHMLYWDAEMRLSIAMVTNNALAPDLQQHLQRAIVAFANGRRVAGSAELAARLPHIQAKAGSYRTSEGEVIKVGGGPGPLLRLTRRGVTYDLYPVGNGIGYAPGLDTYVTGSATEGLNMLSLYESREAVPLGASRPD